MGRGNFGYLIAQLAVETGIAPQYLLDLDADMFKNMLKVLNVLHLTYLKRLRHKWLQR